MNTDRTRADESASRLERNLADNALENGDYETAWTHLNRVLARVTQHPASPDRDPLLVDTSLELARVSFVVGKGFGALVTYLKDALKAADRIGDRRSAAMINLHLGRLYYFAEQRHLAMEVFARGKAEVEALGDEDILDKASELIGLYYFIQGLFPKAIVYFEQAAKRFEFGGEGHSGPMWLSYCAAFLGQFHRAIGTLDFYRRLALERSDHNIAMTLRAVLGIILMGIRKTKDAAFHLSGALQESAQAQNALAHYFAMGGLSIHHMMEGRLEESREWMVRVISEGARAGLVHQYASPIVLETLFEFQRNRIAPISGLTFDGECRRIQQEPNVHLQGVALRLKAAQAMAADQTDDAAIEALLLKSETLLRRSGDPVQLGKTRLEMARLKLNAGEMASARQLAQKAWKGFCGYGDVFYPDDLRPLLTTRSDREPDQDGREELLEMFSDMIQDLVPSDDPDELLQRTVSATNRFFGAERGGIFWFQGEKQAQAPRLRAACNLVDSDLGTDAFRACLTLIFKAYRENQPQVFRHTAGTPMPSQVRAMMAVPFQVEGRIRGVLYHDTAYVNDCFDRFAPFHLARMARSLSRYIEHVMQFTRKIEARTSIQLKRMGELGDREMVGGSPALRTVLDQADRIAATDSSVLILGETGVGKELLARRIHAQSLRQDHPMVVVDPTAIPETLVESELFGHEKGAFTGADRQKAGRLELAHNGTLFIDEVGEIPMTIQVKLLRALQEKTMVRVGGTRTLSTNFRLIAATNRNLAAEVEAGRFREDLYYRLNVIPIVLPPLRDRGDDVLFLAQTFIDRFRGKYNRPTLQLTRETETLLLTYDWPGNVRELENIIERSVLLSSGPRLELSLPAARKNARGGDHPFEDLPSMDEMQRRYIAFVLGKTNGKIAGDNGAAALLGMKRTSLYNRMNKLGMR
ncbi:MAG: sigma 54-interacting transcriptional regulator [Desulfobacterales bacterium]|nr:sigma 54-interacting transcriptional regulator [Desulfobacterales bacterium]